MSSQHPSKDKDDSYHLSPRNNKVVQPLHDDLKAASISAANPAADLIRKKLNTLYADEPKAKEELAEAEVIRHRSKHQQFMYDLSNSGKSLAEIQTAWHNYYINLPNDEKHEVWQEFYANHSKIEHEEKPADKPKVSPVHHISQPLQSKHARKKDTRTVADIKSEVLTKVQSRSKLRRSHHLQSLAFGLSMGLVTILIFLFGFFNERFIAPFITPSRAVSSTPIIIDPNNTNVGPESKIIIPKINVEIPVVYDEPSINEDAIQRALEKGVVHYPTTSSPGELGNGVIFGHSANNILNKGKYKFAFVLLKHLENGDVFYIQKDGKRYAYRVFDKKVVEPSQVEVLHQSFADKPATFTLITCDPPGTSLKRMVVTAEQITPDPSANLASTGKPQTGNPEIIPSNSPSLWQRIKNWFS